MNRRAIALTAAFLFVLSWIFPVSAGLVRNPASLPKWWGTVDVALAFVVAVGALVIPGLGRGNLNKQAERTTYRIYPSSLHGLFSRGCSGHAGRRSDQVGELRDGLSLAYVAILVHSPVVACCRRPPSFSNDVIRVDG